MGCQRTCGRPENMTLVNSSVKMSSHEEGDSHVERKGTTTRDGAQPDGTGRTHRATSCQAHGTVLATSPSVAGGLQEGWCGCPGSWQSRTKPVASDPRRDQGHGGGVGSRALPWVQSLPVAGGTGGEGRAASEPFIPLAHPHRGQSPQL